MITGNITLVQHNKLIRHHTKYEEIHGVDEVVWMTRSEHGKLHRRLREKNKCNIPSEELAIISLKAHSRAIKKKREICQKPKKSKQERGRERYIKRQSEIKENIKRKREKYYAEERRKNSEEGEGYEY